MLGHLEFTGAIASFGSLDHDISKHILQGGVQTICHLRNLQLVTLTEIVEIFGNVGYGYNLESIQSSNFHHLPPCLFCRK